MFLLTGLCCGFVAVLLGGMARAATIAEAVPCAKLPIPAKLRVFAIPGILFTPANSTLLGSTENAGFLVDLLNGMQNITGIPYELTVAPTLVYGTLQPNGTWPHDSLVGYLIDNKADVVGPDLTLSPSRTKAVDFLSPYTSYELEILANTAFGLDKGVQYVVRTNSNALNFLKLSKNEELQAIYANIQAGRANGSVVVTEEEGMAKVLSGNFAFINRSPFSREATSLFPEKLARAGGSLGTFYYSFAVQKGSPLRDILDAALLELQADGTVKTLLRKYEFWSGCGGDVSDFRCAI